MIKVTMTKSSGVTLATANTICEENVKVTIANGENIKAENIKKDVQIADVIGTLEGGGGDDTALTGLIQRDLTDIVIPNSVTSIGNWTFGGCSSLASITIPNSVTSIGNYVFNYCTSLTSVTLGNGFNANNLKLSASNLYTAETIVSWLEALADRTGQKSYTLTIGSTNIAKLTEAEIAMATNKNWTLA